MAIELIPTSVPITAHHIAYGFRHRCYACPLALAVDDQLIEGYSAIVSPPELAISDMTSSNEIVIILPHDAIKFVEDYDDERPVSPKSYLIPLPRHLLRNPPPLSPAASIDRGRGSSDAPQP